MAHRAADVVRILQPKIHYEFDEFKRNVLLTGKGVQTIESLMSCGNLYDPGNHVLLNAVSNALHARVLLRKDVDYLVKNSEIELIDEFKGRLAQNRRWPDGLQAAVEAKEGLAIKRAGQVLGSITMQNFIRLYPQVCGMTGTAETQAAELGELYGLEVVVIPTNRPVIRIDHPDAVFPTRDVKHQAVIAEISKEYALGRPVLAGTASVEESELLGEMLARAGVPHKILNARNEEAEAAIIKQAGRPGAVTISTNMAGRGTDIVLGGNPPDEQERVMALGGLSVIGTTRHESRRIDNQLRGRAGRQGDPVPHVSFLAWRMSFSCDTVLRRDTRRRARMVI